MGLYTKVAEEIENRGTYTKVAHQLEKDAFITKALSWGAKKLINAGKSISNWGKKNNNMFSSAAQKTGDYMKGKGWSAAKTTRDMNMGIKNQGGWGYAKDKAVSFGKGAWNNKGKIGGGAFLGWQANNAFNDHSDNIANGNGAPYGV